MSKALVLVVFLAALSSQLFADGNIRYTDSATGSMKRSAALATRDGTLTIPDDESLKFGADAFTHDAIGRRLLFNSDPAWYLDLDDAVLSIKSLDLQDGVTTPPARVGTARIFVTTGGAGRQLQVLHADGTIVSLEAPGAGGAPVPHSGSHEAGGSDPVTIVDLDTGIAGAGEVLTADGLGGSSFAPGGVGAIVVKDEGATVPNGPHGTVNFIGTAVVATDAGGGQVNITVSAAGSNALFDEDTHSASNGQTAFALSTPFVGAGGHSIACVNKVCGYANPVDYTITGSTMTWNNSVGTFPMETNDEVTIKYQTQ